MSDNKIYAIGVALVLAFIAIVVTLMLTVGADDADTQCVHIGSNPCVPVSTK